MSIYSDLTPQAALNKWYALRQTSPDQLGSLTPEERAEATSPGGMVTLAQQNPGAWNLMKTGTAATANASGKGSTRKVFDPTTGQWNDQAVKTVWDHPETWIQLGAGAGLGGLAAAPFIAGAAAGGGGASAGGGLTSTALTNAAIQGGLGAVQGGMTGGVKGALTGGALGFGTGLIPGAGPANTLGGFAKNAAIDAGVGAAKGAVGGGGVSGALKGAAGGAVNAIPLGGTGLNPILTQGLKGAAQGGITGGARGAVLGGVGGATSGAINQATAPLRTGAANTGSPVASTAVNTGTNLATKVGTGLAVGGTAAMLKSSLGGGTPTPAPTAPSPTATPASTAGVGLPSAASTLGPSTPGSTTTSTTSAPTFSTPGGGGTTMPAGTSDMPDTTDTSASGFWNKYGGLIAQGGGLAASMYAAKKAQESALTRSPEEAANLAGAQGAAGGAGQAATGLMTQARPYIAQPASYYQTLLNGNRAAMANATAAPRAQLQEGYRGAQRGLAASGIRGAARDVLSGQLNRQGAGQIAGLTTGVQPAAAQALAGLGTDLTKTAAPLYGTAGNIYGNLLNLGQGNRYNAQQEGAKTGASLGSLVADLGKLKFGNPTTKKTTPGGPVTPPTPTTGPNGEPAGYYPQPAPAAPAGWQPSDWQPDDTPAWQPSDWQPGT